MSKGLEQGVNCSNITCLEYENCVKIYYDY